MKFARFVAENLLFLVCVLAILGNVAFAQTYSVGQPTLAPVYSQPSYQPAPMVSQQQTMIVPQPDPNTSWVPNRSYDHTAMDRRDPDVYHHMTHEWLPQRPEGAGWYWNQSIGSWQRELRYVQPPTYVPSAYSYPSYQATIPCQRYVSPCQTYMVRPTYLW